MADNITLNQGASGDTLAADDIGGVKHQRVKMTYGADGSATDVSPAAPLPTLDQGVASDGSNTTTTPLTGSATFTGTSEQNNHADVMVSCITDAAGTLYFDFSVDGTNWGSFPSNGFTVSAGIHEFHTASKGPRYFRLRLVNGSDAQTYLRLYTYFGTFRQPNSPLNQTLGADADAALVRTIDPMIDLALGRLGGAEQRNKFGYSTGLGTGVVLGTPATWEHLWAYGGIRTSPTTSFTPYMASDASGDTDIDIAWQYLDASGIEQTVTVATNASDGRTPVSLGVTATEVYRGYNVDSTEIAGNVACVIENDFTNGVPDEQDEVLAYITANDQQSQVLAFRVPSDKKAILQDFAVTLARANGSAGAADIVLQARASGGVYRSIKPIQVTTGQTIVSMNGVVLEPSTDVRVQIRDVSDNTTAIAASLAYIYVDA